ncbi:MAG: phage major tail protein, TP901-1 family [Aestuariivirga sp.]|uniref:phage major tail protein, TP901-1 family n=1 Tax=Aestuariivirga sp. TaxID=2650926 RepID=UPI0025C3A2D2|nr:phage major tail protein, TP901-1 family [Aestuariivirga sp.]MCA3561494.1 phage major tail protein, TP901-1 family [Aestuariivirga sp.]
MGAQKGRDLLLKLDAAGTGSFAAVAGLRSNQISFNAGTVDATNQDSPNQWRELLSGAGIKSAAIRGSGIFKDAASDAAIRSLFFAGSIRNWQVVVPDFGTLTGPFQIASLEFAGRHDGEVSFDLALESAGEISFAGV